MLIRILQLRETWQADDDKLRLKAEIGRKRTLYIESGAFCDTNGGKALGGIVFVYNNAMSGQFSECIRIQ